MIAPEQVAGRPARQRVPRGVPRQRGRVLRQLLRLLPARGLRPVHRHLHREGQLGERGDRTAPALGHRGAAGPARRAHRGVGLVHLRPGLARGVRGPDPSALPRHRHPARVRDAAPGRHPVPAQQHEPRARHVPGPGRHARGLPAVRDHRLPDRVVGRHGREDLQVRPGHRRADQGRHRRPHGLPGVPLRGLRGPHEARVGLDRGRASTSGSPRSRVRASCSRPNACACAPATTWR